MLPLRQPLLLLLACACCRPVAETATAVGPAGREPRATHPLRITIDAHKPGRRVSPLLFGTNLEPNAEVSAQVTRFVRSIGITTYRFPGGGSVGWRWTRGVLDNASEMNRCPLARLDAVKRFVEAAGGEVVMQLNIETGTADEAAALLRWMRDPSHAFRGNYFEVGNEPYGNWDAAYSTPATYARKVREFAAKLRAVDPRVKVGALLGGEYYDVDRWSDSVDNSSWDRLVLEGAGEVIDFVSMHWYPGDRKREDPLHVMGNSLKIPRLVGRIRRLDAAHSPPRKRELEIGFLEWDGVFDQETTGMRHTLANAIMYADAYMQMASAGVSLANHYELHTRSYGLFVGYDDCMKGRPGMEKRFARFDGRIRPKAFALQLAARMAGGQLLDTRVAGSTSYRVTTHRAADEYEGDVPHWAAYAARHADRLTLLIISRHPSSAAAARIRVEGFVPQGRASLFVLTGPALTASNEERAGVVEIRERTIEVDRSFTLVVPPASVSLVEIRGR